jgi:hypothetical protein
MAEKKQPLITPVGDAEWAWLTKPKAPFAGDPNKDPKFMIDVVFDPKDPAWAKWGADFRAAANTLHPGAKLPIKPYLDDDKRPTGKLYMTFKTGEKYPPKVFDIYGRDIPENVMVGNGSKVRVSYAMNYYEGFGGGINLYLQAVQILDLVEYKGRSAEAYGFQVETVPVGATTAAAGGPPPAEDDLPF